MLQERERATWHNKWPTGVRYASKRLNDKRPTVSHVVWLLELLLLRRRLVVVVVMRRRLHLAVITLAVIYDCTYDH